MLTHGALKLPKEEKKTNIVIRNTATDLFPKGDGGERNNATADLSRKG